MRWILSFCFCARALGQSLSPVSVSEPTGIDWRGLLGQSFEFLGLEHGFRYVTQEGTRHPHVSFFGGYIDSLNNQHGWADGDPFIVNYVGHPMQGAATGFLFVQNDRAFRTVEFGKNSRYWKSRLRATAFAWAYSEQFETGPLSEATIGNTQAFYPQQGFADHVATPALGLAWMIAEDSIDKYLIKRIESRTNNPYVWILLRGGLNPTRSLANVLAKRVPWHRDTRCDPGQKDCLRSVSVVEDHRDFPESARFEFFATMRTSLQIGPGSRGYCTGGEGAVAYRIAKYWELAGEVGGCKLTRFGENLSGDSLTYLAGPRWTPRPAGQWQPFIQVLVGGRKLTHEKVDPVRKAQLQAIAAQEGRSLTPADQASYIQLTDVSGPAIAVGVGVDRRIKSAIGLRIGEFDYLHSWHSQLTGINYADTVQFTSGLVVRFGTW